MSTLKEANNHLPGMIVQISTIVFLMFS
ncbi:hypothetical protein LINPERHAP1_LOCUS3037 [Linum perenne]